MEHESIQQMKHYIYNKQWSSKLIDLIPAILSNIYNINVKIITQISGKALIQSFNDSSSEWITLVLESPHYNYIDKEKLDPSIKDWLLRPPSKPNIINLTNDKYKKPTLVIGFKSDKWTKQILVLKSKLSCANDFNIVFQADAKLINIARKLSNNQKPKKEHPTYDTGVVYQAKCLQCKKNGTCTSYIGETGRNIEDRMKEHCRRVNIAVIGDGTGSALGEHQLTAHGTQPSRSNWDVEILDRCKKPQHRKELEARRIYLSQPVLNRDTGVHIISKNFKF
jgi:hypothetical protein